MPFSWIGKVFGISAKKIYNWYKNHLSDFREPKAQSKLHEFDSIDINLIDKKTKKAKVIPVPIFEPKNLGKDMVIDDKNLNKEGYTIISNKKTGKIFLMIMTRKAKIIRKLILAHVSYEARLRVATISKDLAYGYDWIANTCFSNAQKIADKFHIIKLALEALQAVRIRIRQEFLSQERKLKKNRKRKSTIFSNGETRKELLSRARYLLFKFKEDWTDSQRERASIFLKLYPEIKLSYDLICQFRLFYKTSIGDKDKARYLLMKWYKAVDKSNISEIKNFASTVKRHEYEILNYFNQGHTNAFAESLNSKLQRFIIVTYGFQDRDFFHFRVKKYFS